MQNPIIVKRNGKSHTIRVASVKPVKRELEKRILSYREAYEFLGVSESFFRKIKSEIPHIKRGRTYLFSRDTLVSWVSGAIDRSE